jgi:beta-fructofuranosidase
MDCTHRPRYHFMPPANWMNDPNGLIQWRGTYHLFYQHNPDAPEWGTMYWGHARSSDLVHWEHLPIALTPTPGGADKDGCWSGCAVVDGGVPVLVYTGVRPEVQCIAAPLDDDLLTWHKDPANPVIAAPPDGLNVTGFRDPCVWRWGDEWRMVLGSGIVDQGGTVFHYRSTDLRHWEFLGPLLVGDPETTGVMWECPNFFPLGDRHVLIYSPLPIRRVFYFSGVYDGDDYTPDILGRLDAGDEFYAPQAFADEAGRRILFGWLQEGRGLDNRLQAGWAGVMTLPRMLSLAADGTLLSRPVPEVEALRRHHRHLDDVTVEGEWWPDHVAHGDSFELFVMMDTGRADAAGICLRASPDGQEQTRVYYDRTTGEVVVDRRQASLNPDTTRNVVREPLALTDGERLSLRIFVDRSVIEIYANERVCFSTRVYPTREDSLGVGFFARGGAVSMTIDGWDMTSIWPEED